jgi:phosphoribosylaminoimidazole-succinocarboxamide synthase
MLREKNTISNTSFNFEQVKNIYHGKVRDVYDLGDKIIMIATDRISAFDHILPKAIPYKGQVLNQIAQYFLNATQDIVPNWLMASPDPNVSIGHKAVSIKIEMVIRGFLSGHAWRTYKSGQRMLCGVRMPEGLKENDRFPIPIITPTTKASEGHDMDISVQEIIHQGIVSQQDWDILEKYTRALFDKGSEMAKKRGLMLVDTKYEFGKVGDKVILIDEIHTPDSSRYFYLDGYQDRQENNQPQQQLSKEFVREWLIQHGFQGLDGQNIPEMPDTFVNEISERYIKLFEIITGQKFDKVATDNIEKRIETNVANWLKNN